MNNICILGPSGVGKSPLENLFRGRATTVEPYRGRADGARAGEKYYVSPEMLKEVLELNRERDGKPRFSLDSELGTLKPYTIKGKPYRKWLEIYDRACFLQVRDDAQILIRPDSIRSATQKIEIWGPVLATMLEHKEALNNLPFLCKAETTVFVLLTPLETPIRDVDPDRIVDGYGWTLADWVVLQKQRNDLRGKPESQEKMEDRVYSLCLESEAWKYFARLDETQPNRFTFVDAKKWSHYEYKYLSASVKTDQRTFVYKPESSEHTQACAELEQARHDIIEACDNKEVSDLLNDSMNPAEDLHNMDLRF